MTATRAVALPGYRTPSLARSRPDLRVAYRADGPVASAPAGAHPAVARPAVARPAVARPAVARPAVASSSATIPLRLTRRGRIVVAVMAALLVAGLSLIVAGAAQATSHSASPRATGPNLAQVIVRPGQSLWSVAENADPNADTRLVIKQIAQLNALTSDSVVAGQRLWVPGS